MLWLCESENVSIKPVVPKVWVVTQTRVMKVQNMSHARKSKPGLHIF